MVVPFVEADFDDVVQELRIKAWRALIAWDPARCPALIGRYGIAEARNRTVFAWMRNLVKDMVKRKHRGDRSIEELTDASEDRAWNRDTFDFANGLFTAADEVYGEVEDEPPALPESLTLVEQRVVCLLYSGYRQTEVARTLGLEKREVERYARSIRQKMTEPATAVAA